MVALPYFLRLGLLSQITEGAWSASPQLVLRLLVVLMPPMVPALPMVELPVVLSASSLKFEPRARFLKALQAAL